MSDFPIKLRPYDVEFNNFAAPPSNFRIHKDYALLAAAGRAAIVPNPADHFINSAYSPGYATYTTNEGHGAIDSTFLPQIGLSEECTESTAGAGILNGTVSIPDSDTWPAFARLNVTVFPSAPDNPGRPYRRGVLRLLGPQYELVVARTERVYTFTGGAIGITGNELGGDGHPAMYSDVVSVEFNFNGLVSLADVTEADLRFRVNSDVYFSHSFSITQEFFAANGVPIYIRLTDSLGYNTGWLELVLPPVARFSYTADGDYGCETVSVFTGDITPPVTVTRNYASGTTVTADPEESFSPTGRLSAFNWGFSPPDPGPVLDPPRDFLHKATDQAVTFDIEGLDSVFPGGAYSAKIELFVYDENWPPPAGANTSWQPNFNGFANYENYHREDFVIYESAAPSLLIARDNVRLTAVQGDDGISIYRFAGDTSTRQDLAHISGKTRPTLNKGDRSELVLTVKPRFGGPWQLLKSVDSGEIFTDMADSPFDSTRYKNLTSCHLKNGGIAVAANDSDEGKTVFSLTRDYAHWADVAEVDTTPNPKTLAIEQEELTENLVITNGFDFTRRTHDFGETWETL